MTSHLVPTWAYVLLGCISDRFLYLGLHRDWLHVSWIHYPILWRHTINSAYSLDSISDRSHHIGLGPFWELGQMLLGGPFGSCAWTDIMSSVCWHTWPILTVGPWPNCLNLNVNIAPQNVILGIRLTLMWRFDIWVARVNSGYLEKHAC